MRYRFNNFEFDSTSLTLSHNGEAVAIRHNEARLLVMLIEGRDQVFSKEQILSQVWQDKIVSEQAVFQNISNLRTLFGNHAIKTFSKRGYQWQLEVEQLPETDNKLVTEHSEQSVPFQNEQDQKEPVALVIGIVATLIALLYLIAPAPKNASNTHTELIQLAYIPFSASNGAEPPELVDTANIQFEPLEQISQMAFVDGMALEYPKLATTHPLILLGELRIHQGAYYVDFLIKGSAAEWDGQLHAPNKPQLLQRLYQHLSLPVIYQVASEPMPPEAKQANLLLAHQQHPHDLILLQHLVDTYIQQHQLETAMAMAEKLATTAGAQQNRQQIGNALLLQSTILTRKELFELSQHKLQQAIVHLEASGDLKRQADAWAAKSWLEHKIASYADLKASLIKSAELAVAAKDKQRELHALTYLSVMAHKHKQTEDKYLYLTQAEDKMRAYELPIYHFAKIPFHHAIYSKGPAAKEPHLKRVLEYTRLTPDHWVAQSSRHQLLNHYLTTQRLQDAQSLVQSLSSDNAENSFLKTLLAKATPEQTAFSQHAQRTFEQAQLAGNLEIALDVALLILDSAAVSDNQAFYRQYIQQNAYNNWRARNKEQLQALSL